MCVPFAIYAMTIRHRVAAGSKVQTQRRDPRTALPERLGVAPAILTNTRHIAYSTSSTPSMLTCWNLLCVDMSNKEGIPNRYEIDVVLLRDEHGSPRRWCTLRGRMRDSETIRVRTVPRWCRWPEG